MDSYAYKLSSLVRAFIIAFALFVLILSVWQEWNRKFEVILAEKTFYVEVSDTKHELEKGLSGHKPLLDNEGMFFIFDTADTHGFWMKDMTFPLDIIWIGENFQIIHIEKSVIPETYPKIFRPPSKAMYVLEIKDGETEKLDLKIGDVVQFIKK